MPVSAAQLTAVVEIQNVDESVSQLQAVGAAVDEVNSQLETLGSGAGDALTSSLSGADEALAGLSEEADAVASTISNVDAVLAQFSVTDESTAESAQMLGGALSDVSSTASEAGGGLSEVASAADEAAGGLVQAASSASETAASFSEMSAASSEAGGGLSGLVGGLGDFAGGIMGALGDLGMFYFQIQGVISIVQGLGSALLEPNASMEQMQVGFETLDGSVQAAQQELQNLSDFAAHTPFQVMDLDQAAAKLQAFGESEKNVIPDLTAIGDALSALGEATPARLNMIVDIFGKIQTQGHLTGATMTEMSRDGINAWKALQEGSGLSMAKLQEMVKKGLIPASEATTWLRQGIEKLYGGGMAKQAQTFNGLMSTLKDNVEAAWRAFTGPLFDAAKSGLEKLGNLVASKGFQDFAKTAGKGMAEAFAQIGQAISQAAPYVQQFFSAFQGVGKGIDFKEVAKDFEQFGGQAVKVFADLSPAVNLFQALSSHAQELGKWFQTSVVPALQQAQPGFENLASAGQTLWPVIQQIAETVHNSFQTAFSALLPVFEKAIPLIIQIAGLLAGGLGDAIKFLSPYIQQAVAALGQFAGEIAQRVAPILSQFLDLVKIGLDWLRQNWPAIWGTLGPILKGVWDQIVGVIKIAWALVSGIIKIGLDILSGNWKGAWNDFKTMLSGVWDGIKTYLKGVWESLNGLFKGGMQRLVDDFKPLLQAAANLPGPIGDMSKKILASINDMDKNSDDKTKDMQEKVVQHMIDMTQQSIDHLSKMHDDLVQKIKDTKDKTLQHTLEMQLKSVDHVKQMKEQSLVHAKTMQDQMVGHSIIPDMVNSIISWFSKLPGQALSAVSSLAGNLGGFFSNLATQAITWGKDLISNLISGIQSMGSNLQSAVSDVAGKIASLLHHSTPDSGPLKGDDKWGAELGAQLAKGLQDQAPKVAQASLSLANSIALLSPKSNAVGFSQPSITVQLPPGASSGQPIILQLDGRMLAKGLLPYVTQAQRNATGVRF